MGGEASEAPPHLCAAEAGPPGGDLHRHHPAGDPQGPGLPALGAEDPPGHQRSPGSPPLQAPELASLGRPGREAAGLCAAHAAGGAGGLGPGARGPRSSALLALTPCGHRSLPVSGRCRCHALTPRGHQPCALLLGEPALWAGPALPSLWGEVRAPRVLAWKARTGRAPRARGRFPSVPWPGPVSGRLGGGRAERGPPSRCCSRQLCAGASLARA